MLLLSVFIVTGCITTKYSQSELNKYKGDYAESFLKDQIFYNLVPTGNDHLFIYDAALFVEDQVSAPMSNMRGLCQANGGKITIASYTKDAVLDMSNISTIKNNLVMDQYLGDWVSFSGEITALKKEDIKNKFYYRQMKDYIGKGYFSPKITCTNNNTVLWSVSIIPGQPRKDNSDIDSLYILINVIS